jgi:aspartyl/asparaginyl beta-hydroxylase (cupin superfamily)
LAQEVNPKTFKSWPGLEPILDKQKLFVELNKILDDLEALRESAFKIQRRIEKLQEGLEGRRSKPKRSSTTRRVSAATRELP